MKVANSGGCTGGSGGVGIVGLVALVLSDANGAFVVGGVPRNANDTSLKIFGPLPYFWML